VAILGGVDDNGRILPMFPLGRALLPGEPVPLRVFERRYLEMIETVLAADRRFGVVLISRGWEVGGGDVRCDIGTVAELVDAVALDDTQLAVVGSGVERIKVEQWLPDDPYPVAAVTPWPDGAGEVTADVIDGHAKRIARVYALASELGADVGGQDLSLPTDPEAAVWRLCALVPLGEHDRQRLLETPTAQRRTDLLGELLDEVVAELTLRLAGG